MSEPNTFSGPAPSAALINASRQPQIVTDARGRKISIRRLPFLDDLRLIEGLGLLSENGEYLARARIIASVVSIDGEPEAGVATKKDVEDLGDRLDYDGFAAVVTGYQALFAKPESKEPADIKK